MYLDFSLEKQNSKKMKKVLKGHLGFDILIKLEFGPIAQLAEHSTENAGVGGPTPPWATILK